MLSQHFLIEIRKEKRLKKKKRFRSMSPNMIISLGALLDIKKKKNVHQIKYVNII